MKITFLKGFTPLVKTFAPDKKTPYPLVKKVTSEIHGLDATDLKGKLALYRQYAAEGACLLKGQLKRPLTNESRKGQGDNDALTQTLIIDADGIQVPGVEVNPPLDANSLTQFAERIVSELPREFQGVSYIAHASASMGMKGNRLSMHLEFNLTEAVQPRMLKPYLESLNFASNLFEQQMALGGSGKALTYPIDRCVADNTRMIFIAPPTFHDLVNPFPEDEDRFVLVEKSSPLLNVSYILEGFDQEAVGAKTRTKIRKLRKLAHLPETEEKLTHVTSGGVNVKVCKNPDAVEFEVHMDHGDYVTYNINGGDSHAYYVKKLHPNVVYNFKGETPFMFETANRAAYEEHLKLFGHGPGERDEAGKVRLVARVFRDIVTNQHYNGMFNPEDAVFDSIYPVTKDNCDDFMSDRGEVMPVNTPQWTCEFNPQDPRTVDFSGRFMNWYHEPPMLKRPLELSDEFIGLDALELLPVLDAQTPNIAKVLRSIMGDGAIEVNYFINWFAYILQKKGKTGTAWLFHGVQGTGKGLLLQNIIRPIMGNKYVSALKLENMEEQFNGWMEKSLFAVCDEFRLGDGRNAEKLFNKIKNYITEEEGVVRNMRQNQKSVKLFTNFIFFTNEHDALKLPDDDRRFNIGLRQKTSLRTRYPHQLESMIAGIKDEVPFFASVLCQANVHQREAHVPLANAAKTQLREASADTIDLFVKAIKDGDLRYFEEVMDNIPGMDSEYVPEARNYFKAWVAGYRSGVSQKVHIAEFFPVYNILVGKCDKLAKFSKLMAHRGIETKNMRKNGLHRRGLYVPWTLEDGVLAELLERCDDGKQREVMDRHDMAAELGVFPINKNSA
jgi:hypothetical protein